MTQPTTRALVLEFIHRRVRENRGRVPTMREICEAVGLASSSSAHYHVTALVNAGQLHWVDGKHPAYDVMLSDAPCAVCGRLA